MMGTVFRVFQRLVQSLLLLVNAPFLIHDPFPAPSAAQRIAGGDRRSECRPPEYRPWIASKSQYTPFYNAPLTDVTGGSAECVSSRAQPGITSHKLT